jgi:TPR repeat protein
MVPFRFSRVAQGAGVALVLSSLTLAGPARAQSADAQLAARAQGGQAWSQTMMGLKARDGVDAKPDPVQAVQWFRKAADQGFAPAQFLMGQSYAAGAGVARNPRLAAAWFGKAARGGMPEAQLQLGLMYDAGVGVARDPRKAARLFRAAARQGDDEARRRLSLAYADGPRRDGGKLRTSGASSPEG